MRVTMSMKPGPQDALTPPGHAFHGVTDRGRLALPAAMVLSGIVSVQAGAGIAARLLHEIPPAAVTGLRLWTSAVAIAVITGAGGYFGGAGEVIVWNLRTGRMQQTATAPYPVGALCCNSGRGVAIGTATGIVALQHQHSGVHQGRAGARLSVKVITVRYPVFRRRCHHLGPFLPSQRGPYAKPPGCRNLQDSGGAKSVSLRLVPLH